MDYLAKQKKKLILSFLNMSWSGYVGLLVWGAAVCIGFVRRATVFELMLLCACFFFFVEPVLYVNVLLRSSNICSQQYFSVSSEEKLNAPAKDLSVGGLPKVPSIGSSSSSSILCLSNISEKQIHGLCLGKYYQKMIAYLYDVCSLMCYFLWNYPLERRFDSSM